MVIVAVGLVLYADTLAVPFLFDDRPSIVNNERIQPPWPYIDLLLHADRADTTLAGRPVAALTFALNYAISDMAVWSYHLFNITIHILAGLTLFAIVRRTLCTPALGGRFARTATGLALTIALLWLAHPLQTESVTYIVQRTESLMGLLMLLTLYCVIRGATSPCARWWQASAVIACAAGMGTKEAMAAAPVLMLMYDRTFLAGSFAAALRKRTWLYVGLAMTWVILGTLVLTGPRASGISGEIGPIEYLMTQAWAIAWYLKLCFWPAPLIFDYGPAHHGVRLFTAFSESMPWTTLMIALLAATAHALRRQPWLGFLGVWFFAILAPSSSFLPIASEVVAEHRMYLPLAAVIVAVVMVAHLGLHKLTSQKLRLIVQSTVAVVCITALGILTIARNQDYQTEQSIWADTVAKRPANPRARTTLGIVLLNAGKLEEAEVEQREAVRLDPRYVDAQHNLGDLLVVIDHLDEAESAYLEALRLDPGAYETHYNYGNLLLRTDRLDEARWQFQESLRLHPRLNRARLKIGFISLSQGKPSDAMIALKEAIDYDPRDSTAHTLLGTALMRLGQTAEAQAQFREALRLNPKDAEAQANLDQLMKAPSATEP
jgi:protein O-mannosyl-transferase